VILVALLVVLLVTISNILMPILGVGGIFVDILLVVLVFVPDAIVWRMLVGSLLMVMDALTLFGSMLLLVLMTAILCTLSPALLMMVCLLGIAILLVF
jgi:hypothetical protein